MCRDEMKAAPREPSLSEAVEDHGAWLDVHSRRLDDAVEDLYAIAARIGMTLPSSNQAMEPSPRG